MAIAFNWKKMGLAAGLVGLMAGSIGLSQTFAQSDSASRRGLLNSTIEAVFEEQDIQLSSSQVSTIRPDVLIALNEICKSSFNNGGNSKVDFASVQIASDLSLNPKTDHSVVKRIRQALIELADRNGACYGIAETPRTSDPAWTEYYDQTLALINDSDFLSLLSEKKFFPVKISWEDIGRYANSVWGDRISDVGIWVRKDETNPDSAQLALSVRKDDNYRDKVLVVPSDKIKIHVKERGRTVEYTLAERLKQLGLTSKARDKNVIVSNQFAVVPVPSKNMVVPGREGHPPRSAFNFSIFPYGSTNFVITDVIEGSANAVVGPGQHQLLFANVNGQKAPFTASRAAERPDLLKLESQLKAKGMDVDVQRYYLIQIPLKKDSGIKLSNMGTPPMARAYGSVGSSPSVMYESKNDVDMEMMPAPSAPASVANGTSMQKAKRANAGAGLTKVAIGHGETEGIYSAGSNYQGKRAEEPIRVTVVYFVTPLGQVGPKDMETFSKAFEAWDKEALWGGSFVIK